MDFRPAPSSHMQPHYAPGCKYKWTEIRTNYGDTFWLYITYTDAFRTEGYVFPSMTLTSIPASAIVSAKCG